MATKMISNKKKTNADKAPMLMDNLLLGYDMPIAPIITMKKVIKLLTHIITTFAESAGSSVIA